MCAASDATTGNSLVCWNWQPSAQACALAAMVLSQDSAGVLWCSARFWLCCASTPVAGAGQLPPSLHKWYHRGMLLVGRSRLLHGRSEQGPESNRV